MIPKQKDKKFYLASKTKSFIFVLYKVMYILAYSMKNTYIFYRIDKKNLWPIDF